MSLYDELKKIAQQVKNQRPLIASEDDTILVSIQPFVRALGYDTQNLTEFKAQFSADAKTTGGEKVDYAILREGKPIIFIEAKAAWITLNETNWKQLYNYFNAEDVQFGILTNGIEYRFYTDLKKSHIMDKQPFLTIDMLNLDERLVKELEGFTKSSFDEDRILAHARRRELVRVLQMEIENPSDTLVKHFARHVHSGSLYAADVKQYAQLLKDAWREFVELEIAEQLQQSGELRPAPGVTEVERTVDSEDSPPNLLRGDIPVFGFYEGHRFEAVMLRTSLANGFNGGSHCILYDGKLTNGKNAMIAAIRTVVQTRKEAIRSGLLESY